jgi:cell division protein ZapA (FtsZ GTPase activity inhibitor)
MTTLLDPGELGALARRVDGWADELRQRARGLLVAASVTRWQSTAAESFRRQAGDLASAIRASAAHVDEAAAALRRHGRQVEIVESAVMTPLEIAATTALDFAADLAVSWLGG